MIETKVLSDAPGIQNQGLIDKTESTSLPAMTNGVIVGRFKRGRMDKAMVVTGNNYQAVLGHDPSNPSYLAVEDVFALGVNQVSVLRTGSSVNGGGDGGVIGGGTGGGVIGSDNNMPCQPNVITFTLPLDEYGQGVMEVSYQHDYEGKPTIWNAAVVVSEYRPHDQVFLGMFENRDIPKSVMGVATLSAHISNGMAKYTLSGFDTQGNYDVDKNLYNDLEQTSGGIRPSGIAINAKPATITLLKKTGVQASRDFYQNTSEHILKTCAEIEIIDRSGQSL